MRLGLGIRLGIASGQVRRPPVVASPVAGTRLLVGVPTVVSGTCTAGAVALSWGAGGGSAGTVTYPAPGQWSCSVTPTLADVAETTLVAREMGRPAELVVTVSSDLADYLGTTPILLDYDAANAVHSGANFTYLDDAVAGAAADRLIISNGQPSFTAADARLGGLPSVGHASDSRIVTQTPGSGVTNNQPTTVLVVCVPPDGTATAETLIDGYNGVHRCLIQRDAGAWLLASSTPVKPDPAVYVDETQAAIVAGLFDATAGSYVWQFTEDGGEWQSLRVASGAHPFGGIHVGATYAFTKPATCAWNRILILDGELTAAEIERVKGWARGVLGFAADTEPTDATSKDVVWVTSDSQQQDGGSQYWARCVEQIESYDDSPLGLACLGDLAGDTAATADADWNDWVAALGDFDPSWVTPPIAFGALGNHDCEATDWDALWTGHLTGQADQQGDSTYYFTVVTGRIRWIVLDSLSQTEAQTVWLSQVLAAATEDWVIPVWHIHVYRADDLVEVRQWPLQWVQMFEDSGKVRLVMHGHAHLAQITHPMTLGVRDDEHGIVYAVVPAADGQLNFWPDPDRTDTIVATNRTDVVDATNFLRYVEPIPRLGFARVLATETTLTLEMYRLRQLTPFYRIELTK